MQTLLLTDVQLMYSELPLHLQEAKIVDVQSANVSPCIGCYTCWIKTPGKCVFKDDAVQINRDIIQCETVIYISRVKYGCYDTPLKRILDRTNPIQQQLLRLHENEIHQVQRDVKQKDVIIIGYGDISDEEKHIFENLVARNALHMSYRNYQVIFCKKEGIAEVLKGISDS